MLGELGAVVVDADALAREVLQVGTPGLAEVVQEFGPEVLAADGSLDRAALARIVFADPERRQRLEAITHPRIAARTAELIRQAPADAVVVHDVPLLVEKGMADRYDLVVIVGASQATRLRRLADRGMSADDARARIAAQATDDQRREVADVWIENDGPLTRLHAQVEALWDECERRVGREATPG